MLRGREPGIPGAGAESRGRGGNERRGGARTWRATSSEGPATKCRALETLIQDTVLGVGSACRLL